MNAFSSMSLSGRSPSGSKTLPPPFGLADLARLLDDQLVDQRALPLARSQQATNALHVLALAHPPGDHDSNLGVRDIDPFVEDLGRDQRAQAAVPETGQHLLAFGASDVAGQRHDQVL